MNIIETITDKQGRKWTYEVGQHRHQVVCAWHGRLSRRSNRETWNRELIIGGPLDWSVVKTSWEGYKLDITHNNNLA